MKKQSRETNSIINFSAASINQVLILFLNLISKSIFLKSLGTVFMGINGLFTNIFLLLSFAEFGIGSVMVYSLYAPINRGDEKEIAAIYHLFRKIYITLSFVITAIGLLIIPLIPLIINVEQDISNIKIYYSMYLISVVVSNTFMYKSHIILADQRGYILSVYNLFFEVSTILIQIFILLRTGSYIMYLTISIIKNCLYAAMTSHKVRALYPFLKNKYEKFKVDKAEKKVIYTKIFDVFSYKFARVFITGTDNVLISILVGTIWVGYYSNYDMIVMGVMSLVQTLYVGISASVGDFIAEKDIESQYRVFEIIQTLNIWITGFTTTCLFILFQDFIALWLGKEYVIDFKIVILIVINYYLVCNRKSISMFREASGMFSKIRNVMFLAAVMNIVLSVGLGRLIGIYGVLLGTIISALSTYYWYEGRLLIKDKFKTSMKPFIKDQIENLIYTCVSIVLTSIAVITIKDVTVFNFIMKMMICLLVPNIFYFVILKNKDQTKVLIEMAMRNYRKIRRRLKNV